MAVVDRTEAVTLLLRSLLDLRFEPMTATGAMGRGSRRGEGPSERMPCGSCRGEGSVRQRGVPVECGVCEGRGWLVVDSYTLRPIGTTETGTTRAVTALRCDGCGGSGAHGNGRRCEYCRGSGWVEVALETLKALRAVDRPTVDWSLPTIAAALDEGFAGSGRAWRSRRAAGSFEELDLAMRSLRDHARRHHRLVWVVYVESLLEPEDLREPVRDQLTLALRFLTGRMPGEIRVPGWAARNERRRRERLRRLSAGEPLLDQTAA